MDLADLVFGHRFQRHQLIGDNLTAVFVHIEHAAETDRLVGVQALLILAIGFGPDDHLHHPGLVFQRERGVAVALFIVLQLERLDHSGQAHLLLVGAAFYQGGGQRHHPVQAALIPVEGMAGNEEAQDFALVVELLALRPLGRLRQLGPGRILTAAGRK